MIAGEPFQPAGQMLVSPHLDSSRFISLCACRYTALELQELGYATETLRQAGVSLADLKMAGASASDLRAAGISAIGLKACHLPPSPPALPMRMHPMAVQCQQVGCRARQGMPTY